MSFLGATLGLLYKYKYGKKPVSKHHVPSKVEQATPPPPLVQSIEPTFTSKPQYGIVGQSWFTGYQEEEEPPQTNIPEPVVIKETPNSTVYEGAAKVDFQNPSTGERKQITTPVAITVDKKTSLTTL